MACCDELKAIAGAPPTPCDCPLAGYCQRHGIVKIERWHALCKSRLDYWKLYEAGIGPGQSGLLESQGASPSLLQKVGSLATAAVAFAADGFALVTHEQRDERLKICQGCDQLIANVCGKCGCYMPVKSRARAMQCPLSKWPAL